jgi:TonB family protein
MRILAVMAVLLSALAGPASSSEEAPPAGQLTRELLRHMGAVVEDCPQSELDRFPGHVVVCAAYPRTFSFFKLDWESTLERYELPVHPKPLIAWTKRSGRYVREYDADGTKITVNFQDVSGRLLVAFIPPSNPDDEEIPEEPAPASARQLGARDEEAVKVAGFGGVTLPQVILDTVVEPETPRRLLDAERDGWVLLSIVVQKDGTVRDIKVLRADPQGWGLEEAASEVVAQWRYQPALLHDEPVNAQHTVRIRFERPDPS